MKTAVFGEIGLGLVPLDEQLFPLTRCQQRQRREVLFGVVGYALEKHSQVPRHSRDSRRVEEVSVVFEGGLETLGRLRKGEPEI